MLIIGNLFPTENRFHTKFVRYMFKTVQEKSYLKLCIHNNIETLEVINWYKLGWGLLEVLSVYILQICRLKLANISLKQHISIKRLTFYVLLQQSDSYNLTSKLQANIFDPTACFQCFPRPKNFLTEIWVRCLFTFSFWVPNLNYRCFYLSFSATFVVPRSLPLDPLFAALNLFCLCFGFTEFQDNLSSIIAVPFNL